MPWTIIDLSNSYSYFLIRKLYIKEKLRNRPNTLIFNEIITFKNKYDPLKAM